MPNEVCDLLETRSLIDPDEIDLKEGLPQTEQIVAEIKRHDITGAMVKIMYHIPAHEKDLVDIRAINHACISACEVVAIIPIHVAAPRIRRVSNIHVGLDTKTVLTSYFESKKELEQRKEILVEKALSLLYTQEE
jgi:hypothetical protein